MYDVLHLYVWIPLAYETVIIRVFQLTALVNRGSATGGEKFFINLDRVSLKEEKRSALLCLQAFVRSPNFT